MFMCYLYISFKIYWYQRSFDFVTLSRTEFCVIFLSRSVRITHAFWLNAHLMLRTKSYKSSRDSSGKK